MPDNGNPGWRQFLVDDLSDLFDSDREDPPILQSPKCVTKTRSESGHMPSPPDHASPVCPLIKDPLTGLPYEPVSDMVLEMMARGKQVWCFYSIPGSLYYLTHLMSTKSRVGALTFNLDTTPHDHATRTGKVLDQDLCTYSRIYMRWLMTSNPHKSLAVVNPDGSVLITQKGQLCIWLLRKAVAQSRDPEHVLKIFKSFLKKVHPSTVDWGHVMKTEPSDYLSMLWYGVLPQPQALLNTHVQPIREAMRVPYSVAAHEKARSQCQPVDPITSHVPGESFLWIPGHDQKTIHRWALVNNHYLRNQHDIDPFNIEVDQRTRLEFRDFIMEKKKRGFQQQQQQSMLQHRDTFWRSNRDDFSSLPSRIVKLKIHPTLLAQRLHEIQIRQRGNPFSTYKGTLFPRSRAQKPARSTPNNTVLAPINATPNPPSSASAWATYKHQIPDAELEKRYDVVTHSACENARADLVWELVTSRVGARGSGVGGVMGR